MEQEHKLFGGKPDSLNENKIDLLSIVSADSEKNSWHQLIYAVVSDSQTPMIDPYCMIYIDRINVPCRGKDWSALWDDIRIRMNYEESIPDEKRKIYKEGNVEYYKVDKASQMKNLVVELIDFEKYRDIVLAKAKKIMEDDPTITNCQIFYHTDQKY